MRPLRLLLAAAVLAALPACGSSACAAGMCGAPAASPSGSAFASTTTTAADHGWTTTAVVAPDPGPVRVTLRVAGPLQVDGGCVAALTAWLVAAYGRRLEGSPTPGVRCNAIQVEDVPAGQSAEFTTSIGRPPPGGYAIHGLLRTHLTIGAGARVVENLPVVRITVP